MSPIGLIDCDCRWLWRARELPGDETNERFVARVRAGRRVERGHAAGDAAGDAWQESGSRLIKWLHGVIAVYRRATRLSCQSTFDKADPVALVRFLTDLGRPPGVVTTPRSYA